MKREVGVFSGSFNPIHAGHLILANYMSEFSYLDEVWFVVTPQNPKKKSEKMLDEKIRLEMVQLALDGYKNIVVSDVELRLPRPSYTINTLEKLSQEHKGFNFSLIIGADNWSIFDRWKDYKKLVENFRILIYPRPDVDIVIPESLHQTVQVVKAPVVEISSTFIRNSIRDGKNVRAFVPPKVYDYIVQHQLYHR